MSTPDTEASTTEGESRIGQVVSGRYRIQQLLGEGGMGAVYLAEHTHMRKRVALKLLHPEMSKNAEVLARFEREAMAASHIEHPNVAAATDFGRTDDGAFFLILEYIEGTNLRTELANGPLSVERALHVTRQMCFALSRAHEAGIVHRDLKPENVMLVRRGDDPDFVKVLDFGIAKLEEAPTGREGAANQPLTRLGTILGTPEYMAPEQALGEAVTPQADLYALGIMLYEMLTGLHPFDAPDQMAVLSFHIVAPVPAMQDRAPGVDVPAPVEAVVRRLLEKDAKARPESARALVAELDAAAAASGLAGAAGAESTPRLAGLAPSTPDASAQAGSGAGGGAKGPDDAAWSSDDSFAKTSHGESAVTPPGIPRDEPASEVAMARTALGAPAARVDEPGSAGSSPLHAAMAALRALPRPVQLGVLAAPLVGFALVLVAVLALRGSRPADASDGAKGGGILDTIVEPLRPKRASEEALRAADKDQAALEALAKEFPDDPAVLRALVVAYQASGRSADALKTVRALAALDADALKNADDVLQVVLDNATKGQGKNDDEAFAILEDALGERGVDELIDLTGSRAQAIRSRAAKSLLKPEVRARASKAALALLDFKAATGCAAKKELLGRAKGEGDARLLSVLKPMRQARGCGFMGMRDCFPCLRKDDALDDAIAAIEQRVATEAASPSSGPTAR